MKGRGTIIITSEIRETHLHKVFADTKKESKGWKRKESKGWKRKESKGWKRKESKGWKRKEKNHCNKVSNNVGYLDLNFCSSL